MAVGIEIPETVTHNPMFENMDGRPINFGIASPVFVRKFARVADVDQHQAIVTAAESQAIELIVPGMNRN